MERIWSEDFTVHSYEVDSQESATVPALCRYMQEVAWHHAEHLGVGYKALLDRNLAWVLYSYMVRISTTPR